jgi:hypothetical protein
MGVATDPSRRCCCRPADQSQNMPFPLTCDAGGHITWTPTAASAMSKAVEEAVVEVEIDAMELLTALVDEHKASFAASNPACKRAFEERGAAGLPGGTNRPSIYFEPFPLTFVGSKGGHLTTADGKELVDMQGNMTAGLFGHNEVVKQAVKDVMDAGWSLGGHNENEAKVAAEFTQRFPCCDMVKFCNTGTEATTYAINTARAVSGKPKVLMCKSCVDSSLALVVARRAAGPREMTGSALLWPQMSVATTERTSTARPTTARRLRFRTRRSSLSTRPTQPRSRRRSMSMPRSSPAF